MVINQGDIYWVDVEEPSGSEPGYQHPHVIIQSNMFNATRLNTVIVCSLTSNIQREQAPGNVLLQKGEGHLTKTSVVVVSQILTVDKSELGDYIGTLSRRRVNQILAGVQMMLEPRDIDK